MWDEWAELGNPAGGNGGMLFLKMNLFVYF